jgi:hypothetical protein
MINGLTMSVKVFDEPSMLYSYLCSQITLFIGNIIVVIV